MGGACRYRRSVAVSLAVLCLFAIVAVGPAVALSPPACNEATGIAQTVTGEWVLTSWDRIAEYDDDWERTDAVDSPGSNNSYGVAPGPNGSLWVLQSERLVRLSNDSSTEETVELPQPVHTDGTPPDSADIAYTDRWLVLVEGEVTSYNESWDDPDPQIQSVVPEDAREMVATETGVFFITGNGTLVGISRQPDGNYTHEYTASLDLESEAVDVHPGPNETVLILQPGNVTAFAEEDGDFERLGQRADVFSPEGCNWDGEGYGGMFLFGLVIVFLIYAIPFVLVVLAIAGVVLFLRR